MFDSVLVANRGEIAVRIVRTLRRMGIRSVAVYTDVDRGVMHTQQADVALYLGPEAAYLDVDAVIDAARRSGAQALHPGYGFLAENPALAWACIEAGIVFVGPPPTAIEVMGDKINAKRVVAAAGVPVVPGRDEAGLDDKHLVEAARQVGLPVLLKPSAGGGGKGMHIVNSDDELPAAIAQARREAVAAFGDGTLLVERLVARPRHVEIQVFADTQGTVVSLGERECSLQRRHQKIVEEAPSPLLDESTRKAMSSSAVAAAVACGYQGAGTVEFILSADRPTDYFFMEMNTRLQVEHPVTEAVLGLDLVELQLRVAAGEPLPWLDQSEVPAPRGHAIEARIYAEDPRRGFLPASGTIRSLKEPGRQPGIRVDSALLPGTVVGTSYDPMLAKVVAWGGDRQEALGRLRLALGATSIIGVTTNIGFLRRLTEYPAVRAGELDTGLVERIAPDLVGDPAPTDVLAAAALLDALEGAYVATNADPWFASDGWRLTGPAPRRSTWQVGSDEVEVVVQGQTLDSGAVKVGGVQVGDRQPVAARARLGRGRRLYVEIDGRTSTFNWFDDGEAISLTQQGDAWSLRRRRETADRAGTPVAGAGPVTSPMPGTVLQVHAKPGDLVQAGQAMVSVGAMKMEYVVTATVDGRIEQVLVRAGDPVTLDQVLAVINPTPTSDTTVPAGALSRGGGP
jgi:acetyl-CoA/propionyl-CoA carboxylase, biotin carboxylase, biotin carboxyl carrier protein